MRTINLLPTQTAENAQTLALRSKIYMFSTIVVGMMVLVLAAFAGWWLYLSRQQGVTTQEIAILQTQVSALATQEVLVRQISDRAGAIDSIFETRVDTAPAAKELIPTNGVVIQKWAYDAILGKNILEVASVQPELIEEYVALLTKVHPNLSLTEFDFTPLTGWVAAVQL